MYRPEAKGRDRREDRPHDQKPVLDNSKPYPGNPYNEQERTDRRNPFYTAQGHHNVGNSRQGHTRDETQGYGAALPPCAAISCNYSPAYYDDDSQSETEKPDQSCDGTMNSIDFPTAKWGERVTISQFEKGRNAQNNRTSVVFCCFVRLYRSAVSLSGRRKRTASYCHVVHKAGTRAVRVPCSRRVHNKK